ncbi:DUF2278 family protein [Paraburkholderia sp. MMS20-SJTR3]|uniref:DUF2278 family protein n=1 Tax=Paraburkholderia sejongensis TaxID=2886946 RepID=A0ABS8K255_9BURK|nr:DUF2278 family protein [Paraburkholderia sp. MMS20-SJTR3]MCC8395979.1 DUF2278 family protein [Paraburkholderia sp. MMS20-SJTR3]
MNEYCMFKGNLLRAAPFKDSYVGSPHYVITVTANDNKPFNLVVNSASTQPGKNGSDDVYFYADLNFTDPLTAKLTALAPGLYTSGFPRLDYFQDSSLLDIRRMRPIPYKDENGNRADVNDIVNGILTIDESQPAESLPYDNGSGQLHNRDFWTPTTAGIVVYGFGFLFLPKKDGLHETHMNQGNPRGPHYDENGAFQDGAVIVQRADGFAAMFTAFQTQYLPTDASGNPVPNALALPDYIRGGGS